MILTPRDDIRPEERCFVAQDDRSKVLGYVQVFANGSAAYWRNLGEQAALAVSVEAACKALQT